MTDHAPTPVNSNELVQHLAGIQVLLTARQDDHVKQFLQTEAACQAGRAAQDQVLHLQADAHR